MVEARNHERTDSASFDNPDALKSSAVRVLEAAAVCAYALLVAYACARSVVAAAARPFWFDEMCTWAVAHQPGLGAVWKDTARAIEPNPPPFYVVEHVFGLLLRNQELAYRLPSIIAFAVTLACVFMFVRRRCGAVAGLGASTLLLVTIAFDRYAIEARPYSLVLACFAFGAVCYQRAPARRWVILMEASFLLAVSWHYYGVFMLAPFVMAEAARWWKTREWRLNVWAAFPAAFLPLIFFWPLLAAARKYFGPHFWATPSLRSATDTWGWLFEGSPPARETIALVLLLAAIVVVLALVAVPRVRARIAASDHWNEFVLAAALMCLPLFMLAGARMAGGGMTARYAIAAVLGVSFALGFAVSRSRLAAVMVTILLLCAMVRHEGHFWAAHKEFVSPAKPLEEILRRTGRDGLPVVVSNGLDYLSIAHYAPPEVAARLVALIDPGQSVADMGNDSLDKGLLGIRCCLSVRVYEYAAFAEKYPVFLLYSDGDIDFDRWPQRLMKKGRDLNILAVEGARNLYRVDLLDSGG